MKRKSVDLCGMGMLFLLGLITRLLEQRFTNARLGRSAHLEGVMNGVLLLALGAAWNDVRFVLLGAALWSLAESLASMHTPLHFMRVSPRN